MGIKIIVGLQWGDEGKGKIIDLLSSRAQFIIRAQGGNNAGHSVIVSGVEYHFHLIPSGILYPHTQCFLGAGTVIDLEGLIQEIDDLEKKNISLKNRLWVSPYAHIVFEYHKIIDALLEKSRGGTAIGTTGKGIGPCYVDKAARSGIRICDIFDTDNFKKKLKTSLHYKNIELQKFFEFSPMDTNHFIHKQLELAERLKPFIAAYEAQLNLDEKILLEGAQGSLLDLNFGTYPYVTSSNTVSSGICLGAGIPPTAVSSVLGVVKAYTTRVGEGPFPTEFSSNDKILFDHQMAREFGTTTGRKRRVGWFDSVLARFAIKINGVTELALTKLDVLDSFDEIKICVAYKIDDAIVEYPPANIDAFESIMPIYETMPGWKCSTQGMTSYAKLPKLAKDYIQKISAICRKDINIISTGPSRGETIMKGFKWK